MQNTKVQNALPKKIEAVAAALPGVSGGKRELLEMKLVNLLLEYKGLSAYSNLSNADNTAMDDFYNSANYSGIIFTEVYQYAIASYGKLDSKTGRLIPFLQHFNYAWALKKPDLIKETIEGKGEEQNIKRAQLRELIYNAGTQESIAVNSKDLDFNLLNRNKLTEMICEKGFSDEVLEQALDILDNAHICGLEAGGNEDDEDSDALLSDLSDQANYDHAMRVFMQMLDCLDEKSKKLLKDKDKEIFKYLVTVEFCKYNPSFEDMNPELLLKHHLSKAFLAYYKSHPQHKDPEDALAAFSGNKRETILKNFSRVRKLLAA